MAACFVAVTVTSASPPSLEAAAGASGPAASSASAVVDSGNASANKTPIFLILMGLLRQRFGSHAGLSGI
jgi:hypothetical protein